MQGYCSAMTDLQRLFVPTLGRQIANSLCGVASKYVGGALGSPKPLLGAQGAPYSSVRVAGQSPATRGAYSSFVQARSTSTLFTPLTLLTAFLMSLTMSSANGQCGVVSWISTCT